MCTYSTEADPKEKAIEGPVKNLFSDHQLPYFVPMSLQGLSSPLFSYTSLRVVKLHQIIAFHFRMISCGWYVCHAITICLQDHRLKKICFKIHFGQKFKNCNTNYRVLLFPWLPSSLFLLPGMVMALSCMLSIAHRKEIWWHRLVRPANRNMQPFDYGM